MSLASPPPPPQGSAQAAPLDASTSSSVNLGASTSAAPSADQQAAKNPLDGVPNTELRRRLEGTRKELQGFLMKKKKVDRDLANLEASIYNFETTYLSDTLLPSAAEKGNANSHFGNIIKGYDAFLKAPASSGDRKRNRMGEEVREQDRMFSRSSGTYQKAMELGERDLAASTSHAATSHNSDQAQGEDEQEEGHKRRRR